MFSNESWIRLGVKPPLISESQLKFISSSPLYFVATAPSGPEGHVNCSPRPVDWSFYVDSPTELGWYDLVGSGIETVSHLKENARIVLMFCSFRKTPLVLRIHGRGTVFEPASDYFQEKIRLVDSRLGVRALIRVEVERVSTSCGFGVPLMEFVSHRPTMHEWLERKGERGLNDYVKGNNVLSIDQLPGLNEGELD